MAPSITEQLKSGLTSYVKAIRLIWKNHLAKYLLVPVLLNFALVVVFVFSGFGIGDWINGLIERSVENVNGWIRAAMVSIKIILPVLFFVLFIFIGGTIVNILMSPIYTILSEKTETILTGKEFPFDSRQTVKDVGRAVIIAITNTAKQLLLMIPCLLLNLVPVIGTIVSLILMFIINAYFFGSGFMDYTFERWRIPAGESRRKTFRLKFLATASGAIYSIPLYLFCGAFIAAFTGGISAVAATIAQLELNRKATTKLK